MTTFHSPVFRTSAAVVASAALLFGAAACSSSDDASTETSSSAAASSTAAATGQAAHAQVSDAWIKGAESGMTGAFATVHNDGSDDITLTGFTTPASSMNQLHESTMGGDGAMHMNEKAGGFTVAAGQSHQFAPGQDHFMLMDLTGPLVTGSEVPITLQFSDGSSTTFTAQVRDFAGNQENYGSDGELSGGGMPTTTEMNHG